LCAVTAWLPSLSGGAFGGFAPLFSLQSSLRSSFRRKPESILILLSSSFLFFNAELRLALRASRLLFVMTPGILPFALRAGSAVRAAPAAQCHKK
jgi:hypothetical protein